MRHLFQRKRSALAKGTCTRDVWRSPFELRPDLDGTPMRMDAPRIGMDAPPIGMDTPPIGAGLSLGSRLKCPGWHGHSLGWSCSHETWPRRPELRAAFIKRRYNSAGP